MEFIHKVSKGSRYNQIYIPKETEGFEIGDIVKVILLEKKAKTYSSENFKLSDFKKSIIEKIFHLLKIPRISQVFVFGSFLSKKSDYKDIDILLIGDADEKKVYNLLTENIELKFHVLSIKEDAFKSLIKICPLTRSMLFYFVSNKEFTLPKKEFDKKHINFLLMMPQDLLEINAGSRAFYDSLRRLITIYRFLENKSLDSLEVESELEKSLSLLVLSIKDNRQISKEETKKLRDMIKLKLKIIGESIEEWEQKA